MHIIIGQSIYMNDHLPRVWHIFLFFTKITLPISKNDMHGRQKQESNFSVKTAIMVTVMNKLTSYHLVSSDYLCT